MAAKSKILIVGGTGHLGKFIMEASVNACHRTYVLVRDSTLSDPSKSHIIDHFKSLGVNLLSGDLEDHDSLVNAIKHVDVVLSTVGHGHIALQHKLIVAIKQAGNVKKFMPSEYGNDVERAEGVETVKTLYGIKTNIRRAVEADEIPYTYVCAYYHYFYFINNLLQPGLTSPPIDKLVILGDGNLKGIFNYENDIATYTIRAVDDPRTLNNVLYIKPPRNRENLKNTHFNYNFSAKYPHRKNIGKLPKIVFSHSLNLPICPFTKYPHNYLCIDVYPLLTQINHFTPNSPKLFTRNLPSLSNPFLQTILTFDLPLHPKYILILTKKNHPLHLHYSFPSSSVLLPGVGAAVFLPDAAVSS